MHAQIQDPPIARAMFNETGRATYLWLVVRLYLGYSWIDAGWHKVLGQDWGPASLKGYWERAVTVPETGRAQITYDWYRSFLQTLLDSGAHEWMAHAVAWGEVLVGVALILGAFTGIAAFFGAFMNMNFMLAGSASTNPVLFLLAMLVMLAWKNAGWLGADRWLLPLLGTPWTQRAGVAPPDVPRT